MCNGSEETVGNCTKKRGEEQNDNAERGLETCWVRSIVSVGEISIVEGGGHLTGVLNGGTARNLRPRPSTVLDGSISFIGGPEPFSGPEGALI